jgi:hypothetical protein
MHCIKMVQVQVQAIILTVIGKGTAKERMTHERFDLHFPCDDCGDSRCNSWKLTWHAFY